MRRCVSCQHPALQPSWILGICVKDVWTLESTTGVVNKWPRFNPVCMVFHWKLTVDGVMLTRFEEPSPPSCGFCHIPYDELNMPFPTQLTYCYHCRRQKVISIVCLILFIFQVKCLTKRVMTSSVLSSKGSWCAVHNNRSAIRSSCHRKRMLYPGQVKLYNNFSI